MRKFIKKFFIFLNIIILVLYLIGCLLPWLSPSYFWLFGFIGFGFPYLTLLVFFSIIFWLFFKPKFAPIIFCISILGFKQINAFFAFNVNTTFKKDKPNNTIRVLTWNIGCFSGSAGYKGAKKHSNKEILENLFEQNADIICLQEFLENKERNTSEFLQLQKKYPNVYFPIWRIGPHRHKSGALILSKFPIVFSDSLNYEIGENILRADVLVNNDTISIFNTHLDSYRFNKEELKEIDVENSIETKPSKSIWRGIAKRVRNQLKTHNEQADIVLNFIGNTPHPYVFCADLNEVPNNYVYWKLRENKQDAFLKKGSGFGKTFNTINGVLRIDYILPNNQFIIHQCKVEEKGMSDHAMIVADIELNKK